MMRLMHVSDVRWRAVRRVAEVGRGGELRHGLHCTMRHLHPWLHLMSGCRMLRVLLRVMRVRRVGVVVVGIGVVRHTAKHSVLHSVLHVGHLMVVLVGGLVG